MTSPGFTRINRLFADVAAQGALLQSGLLLPQDQRAAIESFNNLETRLHRLGSEMDHLDFTDRAVIGFAHQINQTLLGNDLPIIFGKPIRRDRRLSFTTCLDRLNKTMALEKAVTPHHEAIQRVINTHDILQNWYRQQPKRHKDFFDRYARASAHHAPIMVMRAALFQVKLANVKSAFPSKEAHKWNF